MIRQGVYYFFFLPRVVITTLRIFLFLFWCNVSTLLWFVPLLFVSFRWSSSSDLRHSQGTKSEWSRDIGGMGWVILQILMLRTSGFLITTSQRFVCFIAFRELSFVNDFTTGNVVYFVAKVKGIIWLGLSEL